MKFSDRSAVVGPGQADLFLTRVIVVVLAMAWLSPRAVQADASEEFQINVETLDNQQVPAVAALKSGEFVVVWQSTGSPKTIKGRRINLDSPQAGREFPLAPDYAELPDVAARPGGGFVAAWDDVIGDNYVINIWTRVFDSSGQPTTEPFRVNDQDQLGSIFIMPRVAVAADGRFVVAWWELSPPDPALGDSVYARFFDPLGVPLTEPLTIAAESANNAWPQPVVLADGSVVLVWRRTEYNGDTSALGRRFDWNGTPLGDVFSLSESGTNPTAAALPGGGFVATWPDDGVRARRYDSRGMPVGPEIEVCPPLLQPIPRVAALANDGFTVVWESEGEIVARDFSADSAPLGSEYQVNLFDVGRQSRPALAIDANGNRLVAWQSAFSPGSDSSGDSVQGRLDRRFLFADGFESGDTSAWSRTVP